MATETQARSGLAILWVSWTISLFISLAYAVLGAVTFNSLQKAYNKYPVGSDKAVLHGTMAAALGAPILVVLLDLFSLLILFYKTWKHNGTGFSYGFLDASFLHQGLFVFLSSYVLLSDRGIVQEFKETKLWNKVDATIYTFTYIMGFVVTGVFVILFGLLIVFQSAVRENHDKARRPRYPEEYDERLLDQDSRPPTPGGSVA